VNLSSAEDASVDAALLLLGNVNEKESTGLDNVCGLVVSAEGKPTINNLTIVVYICSQIILRKLLAVISNSLSLGG